VMKLLKPDGWLLLDDLNYSHAADNQAGPFPMSEAQRMTPNVREIFDLIVKQDPAFTDFREERDEWGWAHKGSGARTLTLDIGETLRSAVYRGLRRRLVSGVTADFLRRRPLGASGVNTDSRAIPAAPRLSLSPRVERNGAAMSAPAAPNLRSSLAPC